MDRGIYDENQVHLGGDWTAKSGYSVAKSCVENGHVARAYFVANDPMAVGAIRGFTECGLSIPEDVAVVGFDDVTELSAYVSPALTTVKLRAESLGRLSVNLLVDGIGDNTLPVQLTIPTALVIRESCGYTLKSEENHDPLKSNGTPEAVSGD